MDSFQAKIGWKMMRWRENKNYCSETTAKKFKKLKNTITGSFEAKIGRKRPRKTENKNYRSVPFRSYPTRNRNFQKNSKKIQKIKKYHYGFISVQNRL